LASGINMTVPLESRVDGHAMAIIDYLVPDWSQGWVAICFVSYLTSNPVVKSQMQCLDLVLSKDDTVQLSSSTPPEFVVASASGLPLPNTYSMREGQTIALNVRAFKPPKDDVVTLRLSGDANGDGLLDAIEAAAYYNSSALNPAGARLETVKGGHNATFRIHYQPPRQYAGNVVHLCFSAQGAPGKYRVISEAEKCVSIAVDRCVWTVRESENLVSVAQSLGISWLQVWNYNKQEISRPDLDLAKGQALKVGQLYQVAKGDTLANMAGRFSTSVDMILRMNNDLDESGLLMPDQIVCVTFNSCQSDIVA